MHARESGVVDHLASSDSHALSIARNSVATLSVASNRRIEPQESEEVEEPLYDPKELGGVTGTNLKKSWDMRDVIARTVDGSRFAEWKEEWGDTIVTGFGTSNLLLSLALLLLTLGSLDTAKVHGHQVGIVSFPCRKQRRLSSVRRR